MSDFWKDENETEFRDIPEEVSGEEAPPAQIQRTKPTAAQQAQLQGTLTPKLQQQAPAPEPVQEYIQDEDDEDFSTVLSDARLRLEQGRLYEMVMNNDLFEGTDADPVAVKHVQKQIRNFAKERMEIMLGMRQEASQETIVSSPFNPLEVEVIKAMARTFSKGATDTPEANAEAPVATRQGLKPIALKTTQKQTAQMKPAAKPLQQKATQPVVRKKNDALVDQILAEEGVTKEELDTVFDPSYKPLTKPPGQLSADEIKERNKRTTAGKQVKSESALPMPTPAQEEMLYTQRAQTAAAHPQMQTILNLLNNQPKKQ